MFEQPQHRANASLREQADAVQQAARRFFGLVRLQQHHLPAHQVRLHHSSAAQLREPGLGPLDAQPLLQRLAEKVVQPQRVARVVDHRGEQPQALDLIQPRSGQGVPPVMAAQRGSSRSCSTLVEQQELARPGSMRSTTSLARK